MKERALLIFLVSAVAVSLFFTYERSFVWKNFELINSEEEFEEEVLEGEEVEEVEETEMIPDGGLESEANLLEVNPQ